MYQPEFEDCWALGLVSQHDPRSHIMEIAMDKVHNIYDYLIFFIIHLLSLHLSQFQCKNIFVLQGDENQLVDPRVIHVMLAEEEVVLIH